MTKVRIAVAMTVVVAAACGGGDLTLDELASTTSSGTDVVSGASRVEYAIGGGPASDPVELVVGASAETDGSSYAEVAFFDGSVARLDAGTDLVVAELVEEPGAAVIRLAMSAGRTWHRVPPVAEGGIYEVETPVATAAVRGTTFFVSCPVAGTCTFGAVDGSIDVVLPDGAVVPLDAPASTTVTEGQAAESQPMSFDTAFGDAWLLDNGSRDELLGTAGPGELYAEFGAAFASLDGTHDASGTTTRFDCEGPGCEELSELVHETLERTFVFVVECDAGACGGQATTEYQYNEEFVQENVPLRFDGSSYAWDLDTRGDLCVGSDGANYGELEARLEWRLTPTAAEVRDGRYVVTAADLDVTIEVMPAEPVPAECAAYLVTYSTDQRHTVTRQS